MKTKSSASSNSQNSTKCELKIILNSKLCESYYSKNNFNYCEQKQLNPSKKICFSEYEYTENLSRGYYVDSHRGYYAKKKE